MKAAFFLLLFVTGAKLSSAQSLRQGNLVGLHTIEVTLSSGHTMDEFRSFFVSRVLPEYEKQWMGLRGYLVKSVRGEYKNQFAIVWVFESEAARDRYFTREGKANELEIAARENVKSVEKELANYGTYTVHYRDDWVVQ